MNLRLPGGVALILGALACVPAISNGQTALVAAGTYQIVSGSNPSNCLDVAGPSALPGAALQLYSCGDPAYSKNQVWQVNPISASNGVNGYQLISAYSAACMDVNGVSVQNGAHLQQYTCGGKYALNQLWTLNSFAGKYEIVSMNSAACLDLPGGNQTPGTLMQQWSCSGGQNPNQLWKLVPTGAAVPPTPPPVTPAGGISATFFGLSVLNNLTTSTVLTFGGTRSQDSYPNVNWRDLEPVRGIYNLGNLDLYIAANAARGTDMIYTFNAIPNWASANPNARTANGDGYCAGPANMSEWEDFVRTVATRSAGRIRYWEVWNEPQYYYCGDMPTLVAMASRARSILKSIDPNAVLLSPAGTTEGGTAMLTSFLAAGGGAFVDVIACHGYHYGADENVAGTLAEYQHVMATFNIRKPLWDTESGWYGTTTATMPAGRAGYVAKSLVLHASAGIERFYWYGYDSSVTWGGLTNGGTASPEISAYREARRWLYGATMSSVCAAGSDGVWSCSLTRPNGYLARVLWNPSGSSSFKVPTGYTQYRRIDGSTVSTAAGNALALTNTPILLETQAAF